MCAASLDSMGGAASFVGSLPRTIEMLKGEKGCYVRMIDQRLLPDRLEFIDTADYRVIIESIKTLALRGAPAIGIGGASALIVWAMGKIADGGYAESLDGELDTVASEISEARPTAVNLSWGTRRACDFLREGNFQDLDQDEAIAQCFAWVKRLEIQDEVANRAIGYHGAALLPKDARVITHCNAGSLATAYYGTALGVIYAAHEQGRIGMVYADETRPVLQGARLTAWELAQAGIPVTLMCDNMAASLMAKGGIDAVIVGADRIAANGDTANKIGTYGLAICAYRHGVPFYVAAPVSTIDPSIEDGSHIVIEQRSASEVLPMPIEGVGVYNPAFDVTPSELISAIFTETGVYAPSRIMQAVIDSGK